MTLGWIISGFMRDEAVSLLSGLIAVNNRPQVEQRELSTCYHMLGAGRGSKLVASLDTAAMPARADHLPGGDGGEPMSSLPDRQQDGPLAMLMASGQRGALALPGELRKEPSPLWRLMFGDIPPAP